MADHISYERVGEDGRIERCPMNDYDGSVTGRFVFNIPAYFNENPDEWVRLGWTKHIHHNVKDLGVEFDPQTQFLSMGTRAVDEHTIEDVYHVLDKSEEMMTYEELRGAEAMADRSSIIFMSDWEV